MAEVSTLSLWQQFKKSDCQDSRDKLIERHAYLVSITAGRLFNPASAGMDRDDLVGAGVFGLIKAVDQFDPERKIKFETYAIALIRGAILDMIRGDDWVPRLVRDQQKQLKQTCAKLEGDLGRPATEDEIAEDMGIGPEKLDKLRSGIGHAHVLSIDDLRVGSEQERVADRIPADEPTVFDKTAIRERQQSLSTAMDRLPERERLVVALYYYEGLTFKEIGAVLAVSESRAYQLHAQATTRLRDYLQVDLALFDTDVAVMPLVPLIERDVAAKHLLQLGAVGSVNLHAIKASGLAIGSSATLFSATGAPSGHRPQAAAEEKSTPETLTTACHAASWLARS